MVSPVDVRAPEDGPRARRPIFGIETRAGRDAFVVVVRGELDLATTPRFNEAVGLAEEAALATIVIDLGALTFVDSSGVNALLQLSHRTQRAGRTLLILPGHARVQRVFAFTGLLDTLPFLT